MCICSVVFNPLSPRIFLPFLSIMIHDAFEETLNQLDRISSILGVCDILGFPRPGYLEYRHSHINK
jgi:hypothetical protein